MAAVTLLTTHGLSQNFGGVKAVRNVDFTLKQGQIRALIGPNGAGKTTLVSMLCGRIKASSGSIHFQGQDVTNMPAHKRIAMGMAYTFQITSIFGNLTVYENVALAVQRRLGRNQKQLDKETTIALKRVGLDSRAEQTAGDLAYGHQRLVEIAMGLGQEPKLLILDEPTQGLSDGEIEEFIALIREVSANTTVLLIEHNIPVVMALADRITVLSFGEIIAEGTPEEIHANPLVQAAYLGG
ncbi:branched-chain amino acid ABC transporter substrate-binding protein [Marinosulfonomonas sp. PRT-SC04]|nr:branched-chain amino acid ABC transporter substrate-binding protein [Marinosulfonomonas sp. PRT-SC04]